MAKVLISDQYLTNIANAIRLKLGNSNTITPANMARAIESIQTSGQTISLQSKTVTPNTTTQQIVADSGYDGLHQVTVEPIPSQYVIPKGMGTITKNGIFDITKYAKVEVNVQAYKLLASAEYEISHDSTTATSHATMNIGSSNVSSANIIYVKIRDKAGPRAGYFLGSDTYIFCTNKANNSVSNQTIMARVTWRYSTSNTYLQTTTNTGYGVYPYSLSNDGALIIYKKYNSTNSLTIDGTYVVEVYALDYAPNQGNPYDYSYLTT